MSEVSEDFSTDSFSYSMKEYDNSGIEGNSLKIINQKSSITANSLSSGIKVENLSHAILIQSNELDELIKSLLETEDYDIRMQIIEEKKDPFLFSSGSLIKMLNAITSVKTKLSIIVSLGPRLTDPKENSAKIVDIFRFAEEKEKVQEVLKSRLNTISSSHFSKIDTSSALSPRLSEKSTSHLLSPRVSLLARPSVGSRPVSFDHTTATATSVPSSSSSSSSSSSVVGIPQTEDVKPVVVITSSTRKINTITPSSTPPLPEPIMPLLLSVATGHPNKLNTSKTPPLPLSTLISSAAPSSVTLTQTNLHNTTANTNNNSTNSTNIKPDVITVSKSRAGSNSMPSSSSSSSSSLESPIVLVKNPPQTTAPAIRPIPVITAVTNSNVTKTTLPHTTFVVGIATNSSGNSSKTNITGITTTSNNNTKVSMMTTTNAAVTTTTTTTSSSSSSSKKNKVIEDLALLNTKIATAFSEVSPNSIQSVSTVITTGHTVQSTPISSPRLSSASNSNNSSGSSKSSIIKTNNENNNSHNNNNTSNITSSRNFHTHVNVNSIDDGSAALTLSYKPASMKNNNITANNVLSVLTGMGK